MIRPLAVKVTKVGAAFLKLKPLLIVRKYRTGGGGAVSKMMLNTKLTICRDMYIKRCTLKKKYTF